MLSAPLSYRITCVCKQVDEIQFSFIRLLLRIHQ